MLSNLSKDFNDGYRQALLDVQTIFRYVQADLKFHKKTMTGKLADSLIQTIINNRMTLRDNFQGFIRWNNKEQCFEWFDGK